VVKLLCKGFPEAVDQSRVALLCGLEVVSMTWAGKIRQRDVLGASGKHTYCPQLETVLKPQVGAPTNAS
jgi:hypothetical protein